MDNMQQVMAVIKRRAEAADCLLWDHLHATLTCMMELTLYSLYLQSPPSKAAALVLDASENQEKLFVQKQIAQEMQAEWNLVLKMEDDKAAREILYKACPWVGYHCFREVNLFMQQNEWKVNESVKQLLLAWHPKVGGSSNVEDVFASIQDSVLRSTKNNESAMCNLQCCAIRSFQKRMCTQDGPKTVSLESADFEGTNVRGIKPKIWHPNSASSSNST